MRYNKKTRREEGGGEKGESDLVAALLISLLSDVDAYGI